LAPCALAPPPSLRNYVVEKGLPKTFCNHPPLGPQEASPRRDLRPLVGGPEALPRPRPSPLGPTATGQVPRVTGGPSSKDKFRGPMGATVNAMA
jgi:hypothetical protein